MKNKFGTRYFLLLLVLLEKNNKFGKIRTNENSLFDLPREILWEIASHLFPGITHDHSIISTIFFYCVEREPIISFFKSTRTNECANMRLKKIESIKTSNGLIEQLGMWAKKDSANEQDNNQANDPAMLEGIQSHLTRLSRE